MFNILFQIPLVEKNVTCFDYRNTFVCTKNVSKLRIVYVYEDL